MFDGVEVVVELAEGEADGEAAAGAVVRERCMPLTAEFRSSSSIRGQLFVNDVPAIPFGIQVGPARANCERDNYVAVEGKSRSVVVHAGQLDQSSGTAVKGEGIVVEVAVTTGFRAGMTMLVRKAKKKELTRFAQEKLLLAAMEKGNYSSLLAQITRSKMRKVDLTVLGRAERLLKTFKSQQKEGSYLTHKQLEKYMKWKKVTDSDGGAITETCAASAACPCNAGQAQDGEVCTIDNGAVAEALEGVVPEGSAADRWLFKALVKAALLVTEGCVWKSGGKFIMSNEERNQSANAIVALLDRDPMSSDAAKGMRALVNYTERIYSARVTAVQLNFHPNEKSSHKPHRDIYGAGQKGGINCTCSFMKCVGTVCYSVGSSRQVLKATETDKRSKYIACGEECSGCKTLEWLDSGCSMFFNEKWNNSHTHGIPRSDAACGPRISIALLLA